jgi:hypothetical protein
MLRVPVGEKYTTKLVNEMIKLAKQPEKPTNEYPARRFRHCLATKTFAVT